MLFMNTNRKSKSQKIEATFLAGLECEIPPANIINQYLNHRESEFNFQEKAVRKRIAERIWRLRKRNINYIRSKVQEQSRLTQAALILNCRNTQRSHIKNQEEKLLLTALTVCELFLEKITQSNRALLKKMIIAELQIITDRSQAYLTVASDDYLFIKEQLKLAGIEIQIRSADKINSGICYLHNQNTEIEINWRKYFTDIKAWLLSYHGGARAG